MTITLNMIQTVGVAVVVLLFGRLLCSKINILNKFCIPAPVVGGIIFALLRLVGYSTKAFELEMDMVLKDYFMIFFFTTIGFTASWSLLKKGGIQVVIFLALATVLVVLQNVVGVGLASALGENPLIGLVTGSVPMTGGHGTSGVYGPEIVKLGIEGADTVAMAAATFGLVMGSLIGGPIARKKIVKNNLLAETGKGLSEEEKLAAAEAAGSDILHSGKLLNGFFQVAIAMGIGSVLSMLLNEVLTTPMYIGSMFVAMIMRNVGDKNNKMEVCADEISTLGNLFLQVFLAMALMDLKLWQLASLAIPMIVILAAQTVLMFLFANFVTYNLMGRDYDAAVITAGHCGFGMGATPNAMANMKAVVDKFGGPAERAFLVLPIVGGMFIDFTNAFVITFFMGMLS